MLAKGSRSRDRGATAIIIAICLLLLCGMAAIAVDLGFGFQERRFDQAGSDAAALGGSLEMVITNQANPVQAAVNKVYEMVNQNLARTVPPADWDTCTDPNALFWQTKSDSGILGTTGGSDCISLSENFNTFRVRVPLQGVDTIFGAVIGFDEMDVSAAAEANRNTDWGGGGDFPSGVLTGTSAGSTVCIKTGTGSASHESCGSPSTGDFGNFKPYFYSAIDGDLSSLCVSGEQSWSMARAMADGIDHEFSGYNMMTPNPRINGNWCQTSSVPGPPFPNMVDSAAGYQNNDITSGLIAGGTWPTNYTGRLTRGPYVSANAEVFGFNIDNRPLWDYIDDTLDFSASGLNLPNCDLVADRPAEILLVDHPAAMTELLACLAEADAPPGVSIFTLDLFNTHRVAHAPLFHETALLGSNACCYHIKGIVPIFIQSVYARAEHASFICTDEFDDTVSGMCIHHPGLTGEMGVGPKGLQKIDSASALVLSCALLPPTTCSTIQDGTNPLNFLYDLQLTR